MYNDALNSVLAFASVLAVFVMALVQLVKNSIELPRNIVPVVGLAIGLLVGAVAYPFTDMNLILRLWAGGLRDYQRPVCLNWLLIKGMGRKKMINRSCL